MKSCLRWLECSNSEFREIFETYTKYSDMYFELFAVVKDCMVEV